MAKITAEQVREFGLLIHEGAVAGIAAVAFADRLASQLEADAQRITDLEDLCKARGFTTTCERLRERIAGQATTIAGLQAALRRIWEALGVEVGSGGPTAADHIEVLRRRIAALERERDKWELAWDKASDRALEAEQQVRDLRERIEQTRRFGQGDEDMYPDASGDWLWRDDVLALLATPEVTPLVLPNGCCPKPEHPLDGPGLQRVSPQPRPEVTE